MITWIKNKAYTKHAAFLLAATGWTILIFIGCSMPGRDLPKVSLWEHTDKVVHFTFFFVFYLLWLWYFPKNNRLLWQLIIVSAIYGFALEFYQINFVAGRSFDVWDGVADTVGALVAWLMVRKSKLLN